MTESSAAGHTAEVWGSTWIPGASPVEGFGGGTGYSVAWVRMEDGTMLQVLVDGDAAPAPGATGRVEPKAVGDEIIDVFRLEAGATA